MFGACCQLSGSTEVITDDYNKPLLNPIDFNGVDNHGSLNTGYDGSESILIETSRPVTTTEKSAIYLSSYAPGQTFSPELPTSLDGSTYETSAAANIFSTTTTKVKVTKPPRTTSNKFDTDKYVLVQTLSNDASPKPQNGISDNEIESIESIILMLNDTKTGPHYTSHGKPEGSSYMTTTKLTARPTSYEPTSTRPTFQTISQTQFEKLPTISVGGSYTTKSPPATSYVLSTSRPKRPSLSSSTNNRITSTSSKKPTKTSSTSTSTPHKKKVTSKPLSTSYVNGPTPERPSFSSTKYPSYTTTAQLRPYISSDAPIIDKIGTSTPAPTVIVLGPYGIGGGGVSSTENPSPTVHITPKPTINFLSSTTWTSKPELIKFTPTHGGSSNIYGSIVTKQPNVFNSGGSSSIVTNDFDDPGYYGIASTTARPIIANIQQTVTSASIYAVVDENSLAGISATTPEGDIIHTSPNDWVNFPPVRNPNLNSTASVSPATIEDYDISTPQFVEDDLLNDKMGLLVSKIVESLKDNFHELADVVEEKTTAAVKPSSTRRPTTLLPSRRPPQRTTRRPSTEGIISSSSILSTRPSRPAATTPTRPIRRTTKRPSTASSLLTKVWKKSSRRSELLPM